MPQTDSKILERYFGELSLALGKEGFSVKKQEDNGLSVSLDPNFPKNQPTRIRTAMNKARTRKKIAKKHEKRSILP